MKKVVVASKNPVKIHAVTAAFRKMFPEEVFDIVGVAVPSNVGAQPKSHEETLMGALNRVKNAEIAHAGADFWAGVEGGIHDHGVEMEAFAWVVVKSNDGRLGKGKTGSFFLPTQVAQLIRQGKELGEADDIVFKRVNSKQENGAVGILTDDAINRTSFYTHAATLALIPLRNKELYR